MGFDQEHLQRKLEKKVGKSKSGVRESETVVSRQLGVWRHNLSCVGFQQTPTLSLTPVHVSPPSHPPLQVLTNCPCCRLKKPFEHFLLGPCIYHHQINTLDFTCACFLNHCLVQNLTLNVLIISQYQHRRVPPELRKSLTTFLTRTRFLPSLFPLLHLFFSLNTLCSLMETAACAYTVFQHCLYNIHR